VLLAMAAKEDEGRRVTVGVLALQGAFSEHLQHLRQASASSPNLLSARSGGMQLCLAEVRNVEQLDQCDALILPGGESTAISLVAERSGLLDPLRAFVKYVNIKLFLTLSPSVLLPRTIIPPPPPPPQRHHLHHHYRCRHSHHHPHNHH
jgi:pyridoxal 5'-phosphate synthase pdxT subunit